MQDVAQADQQISIQRSGLVAVQQIQHQRGIRAIQRQLMRLTDDLRHLAGHFRQHTLTDRQQLMLLHIAQGNKTVEPGVGRFLHRLSIALLIHAADECVALVFLLTGKQLPAQLLKA